MKISTSFIFVASFAICILCTPNLDVHAQTTIPGSSGAICPAGMICRKTTPIASTVSSGVVCPTGMICRKTEVEVPSAYVPGTWYNRIIGRMNVSSDTSQNRMATSSGTSLLNNSSVTSANLTAASGTSENVSSENSIATVQSASDVLSGPLTYGTVIPFGMFAAPGRIITASAIISTTTLIPDYFDYGNIQSDGHTHILNHADNTDVLNPACYDHSYCYYNYDSSNTTNTNFVIHTSKQIDDINITFKTF